MKKINENIKVTLTLGQLKRLIKESEEALGSLEDEVKAMVEKNAGNKFYGIGNFELSRYKYANIPVTSKIAAMFDKAVDPSSIEEVVCVTYNGRVKYGRSMMADWTRFRETLDSKNDWLTADDDRNKFYIARISNEVVELNKTYRRMKNKVVDAWWDAGHGSKESKEVDKWKDELSKLGIYVGGEWTEDGPTGEDYGFSRPAESKYNSDSKFKDRVDSLIAKHEAAYKTLVSAEETAVEPYLKKFIEFHNANWRKLVASGQDIPYGLDCDLNPGDLDDALDAIISGTNFAMRGYKDDDK